MFKNKATKKKNEFPNNKYVGTYSISQILRIYYRMLLQNIKKYW